MAKKTSPARRAAAAKPAARKKPAPAKAKASASKSASSPVSVPSREHSITIRKINNGHIVRESGMVGTGLKARYVESETFSKTAPKVTIPKR